jgi:hypothetical protein
MTAADDRPRARRCASRSPCLPIFSCRRDNAPALPGLAAHDEMLRGAWGEL